MTKPVLEAIKAITQFKGTTIPEISSWAKIPKMTVLEVCNANKPYIVRSKKKSGVILGVALHEPLRIREWETGQYFDKSSYGAWSHEGDCVRLHESRKSEFKHLERGHTTGALGDSWQIEIIDWTPENVAAIEAAGLKPWADVVIDDRLWQE